jgi:hypothetical protein
MGCSDSSEKEYMVAIELFCEHFYRIKDQFMTVSPASGFQRKPEERR